MKVSKPSASTLRILKERKSKPKINRRKKIIEMRAEIKDLENKSNREVNENLKSWVSEKINKIDMLLDQLTRREGRWMTWEQVLT